MASPPHDGEEDVWVRKALALLRREKSYSRAHGGDRILFGDKVVKEVISLKSGH